MTAETPIRRNGPRALSWLSARSGRFASQQASLVLICVLLGQICALGATFRFPSSARVASVKDFGAKGDGKTDDTQAIQKAVSSLLKSYRYLYFPRGTYLVSAPIRFRLDTSYTPCRDEGRCWSNGLTLLGEDREGTVIRLVDSLPSFGKGSPPLGMFITASGPFNLNSEGTGGSRNNGFGNSFENMTIDAGSGNPAAVGIDYLANNIGVIRGVTVRTRDRGHAGILLTREYIGPCLIKDAAVIGFDYAIRAANIRTTFTLEGVTISGQGKCGIATSGNNLTVRDFHSQNRVPAIEETTPGRYEGAVPGFLVLLNAQLLGGSAPYAIRTKGNCYLRDVKVEGYGKALSTVGAELPSGLIREFHTGGAANASMTGLSLAVRDPPRYWGDDSARWAVVTPSNQPRTDRKRILAALASGKTTLFLTKGRYDLDSTLVIGGNVRHILGDGAVLHPSGPNFGDTAHPLPLVSIRHASPDLTVQSLILSDWSESHPGLICVEHVSSKPLILRDVLMWDSDMFAGYRSRPGAGELFLENVSNQGSTGWTFSAGQRIWARQFNPEGPGTKVNNEGASLWILGMKTESTGTIIVNRGGKVELLGGYFLNWRPNSAPTFVNEGGQISGSYIAEADCPGCGFETRFAAPRGARRKRPVRETVIGNPYRCIVPLFLDLDSSP